MPTDLSSRYQDGAERFIGPEDQLFVDDGMVQEVKNVRRILHAPEKHPANPLISQDRRWERTVFFQTSCYSVVYDEERREFRCFYQDQDSPRRNNPRSPFDRLAGRAEARVLLATSTDGIAWTKPDLTYHLHDGRPTNVVFGEGVHAFSVLYDAADPDARRRYKMVFTPVNLGINRPKRYRWPSEHGTGLHLATSPDGLEWTEHPDNPIAPAASDVQILTFDPVRRVYVLMARGAGWGAGSHPALDKFFPAHRPDTPPGARKPKRLVTRAESEDAVRWSDPEIVLAPDASDNLDDEHYGMAHWRAGNRYLGLLSKLHAVPNTMDMELVHSVDGREWRRLSDRPPVVPLGAPDACDAFIADCPTPPIVVGDVERLYYSGSARHHDLSWQPPADVDPRELEPEGKTFLCLATIRRNGWVSLTAMEREGYVETIPVFATGSKLVVNALCEPGGYLACELRDPWGNVWAGFEREACEPFSGDAVSHTMSWAGGPGVAEAPGFVSIRFYLRRCSLFSFRLAEA